MTRIASTLRRLPPAEGLRPQAVTPWTHAATEPPDLASALDPPLFDDPVPARGSDDEVWMVSYMDIMTLLLTLFVLLFAYMQAVAPAASQAVAAPVTERVEPPIPAAPISPAPAAIAVAWASGSGVPLPISWPAAIGEPAIPELLGVSTMAPAEAATSVSERVPEDGPAITPAPEIVEPPPAAAMAALDEPPVVGERQAAAPTSPAVEESAQPAEAAAPARPPEVSHPPQVAVGAAADATRNELLAAIRASALGKRVEITDRQDRVDLEVSDDILFDPGSASLRPLGRQLLAELAALLRQQGFAISVEGHTDSVPIRNPRFASNWELSAARATSVTRELIEHAVEPGRVRAVGYADTRPRADNAAPEGRARNRRVALVLHVPASRSVTP